MENLAQVGPSFASLSYYSCFNSIKCSGESALWSWRTVDGDFMVDYVYKYKCILQISPDRTIMCTGRLFDNWFRNKVNSYPNHSSLLLLGSKSQ